MDIRSTRYYTNHHQTPAMGRTSRLSLPFSLRITPDLRAGIERSCHHAPEKNPPIENTTVSYLRTYELPLQQLPTPEWQRPRRPKEKAAWLIIPSIGFHYQEVAGGIRLAWMRRHGIYLYALSDFRTTPDTNGQECDKNGLLPGSDLPPYYTGKSEKSYYAFTAGGIHRIIGNFCLYEGIGYGARTVVWQTDEGNYLRNSSYSFQGITAEAGAILRLRKLAFSVGTITTGGKYWMVNLGLGIRL